MLRFKPMDSLSEVLRLGISGLTRLGRFARPAPIFLKSNGCMFWSRFKGDVFGLVFIVLGGEVVETETETGPLEVGILRKLKGCFWCGDMVGKRER